MYELSDLGFGPFFTEQMSRWPDDQCVPARIAAEHRGGYDAWSRAGEGFAQLAGRLRHELEDDGLPGVGDWVALKAPPAPDQAAVIDRVFARRTVFRRGAAGRATRAQIVAANVDLVFAVCGLDGDFNVHRVERYVARIWAGGAQPVVILNKADVCADAAARRGEIEASCPGVEVHVASALHGIGLAPIRARVGAGLTAALVGSSGAGKSTLVNALLGEERMAVSEVRAADSHGRHTTTHRQLMLLPGGGLLLDTPGMRELQMLDEDGLGAVFEDIAALAAHCRYRDCRHGGEPGCAVRAAVESGELAADRLEHYLKLEREAQAYERRHDAQQRKQSGRLWGQLHREIDRLNKWKRGQ